jgi:hypothetical protein
LSDGRLCNGQLSCGLLCDGGLRGLWWGIILGRCVGGRFALEQQYKYHDSTDYDHTAADAGQNPGQR